MTVPASPGDRGTYLRVAQQYGQLLAELRRSQAEIAAEYDAKIAAGQPVARGPRSPEPDEDYSTMTWLR